ncbi:MAG: class III extradiol ring-cleavage dioxygenase [Erysipelotrichaceae bacterium]
MLPSFFISHGSPMIALEDTVYTRYLKYLAKSLPIPKAIVLLSAHYESPIQSVSDTADFSMIYDFYGFPPELSKIVYPAKGDKALAKKVLEGFKNNGIEASLDSRRGIDHGVWTLLHLMYPEANIPLVVLSIDPFATPKQWFAIGQSLRDLKKDDVLIIGSGVTVHNLRMIDWSDDAPVMPWAKEFHTWINDKISKLDFKALEAWKGGPSAKMAIPRADHFAPLMSLIATASDNSHPALTYSDIQMGSLSYDVWRFD